MVASYGSLYVKRNLSLSNPRYRKLQRSNTIWGARQRIGLTVRLQGARRFPAIIRMIRQTKSSGIRALEHFRKQCIFVRVAPHTQICRVQQRDINSTKGHWTQKPSGSTFPRVFFEFSVIFELGSPRMYHAFFFAR